MVGVGGQGGDEVAVRGKSQWKQIFSRGVGGILLNFLLQWSLGVMALDRSTENKRRARRGERPNQPFSHSTLNAGQL